MYRNILFTIAAVFVANGLLGQDLPGRPLGRDTVPVAFGDHREVMQFEEFALWSPKGKIVLHEPNGVREITPPPTRYFRVRSADDEETIGFLAVDDRSQDARGLLLRADHRFRLTAARARGGDRAVPITSVTAVADRDEWNVPAGSWRCALDGARLPREGWPKQPPPDDRSPGAATTIAGSQSYVLSLDIETDYELYVAFGDTNALDAYVRQLTVALAIIYYRDLKVTVQINTIQEYSSATLSPWHAQASEGVQAALYELGDYYHTHNPATFRSAVVLLSGKSFNGGTAWEGALCGGEFSCSNGNCGDPMADGHYGGPYAVCGSIWSGAVPDTTASSWLPAVDFWALQDYSHELGHVIGGHHTNCIPLTFSEQVSAGRQYVDQCYSDEYGCYSGATSPPAEGGTIMSACFNQFVGSYPQSRYLFGISSEMSHHELDDYMLRSSGPLAGGKNVVSATSTLTMSAITAPSSVVAGSTGNTASISAVAGALYTWSISSGSTITSGANTNAVTFTAATSGTIVVTASVYNGTGCAGITDFKSIGTTTALAAPTGLIASAATGNSVNLVWQPVAGTSIYYNIYRSAPTSPNTFTRVGCTAQVPTSQLPFVDLNGLSADNAYLYQVRAASGTVNSPACPAPPFESPASNSDFATTTIFTHPITTSPLTTVTAYDITSLRMAVGALYKLAFSGAVAGFTDPTILSCAQFPTQCTAIKAIHINELRTKVNQARVQLLGSGAQLSFTDPNLVSCAQFPQQCTPVKATHLNELRAAVQ